jgi:DNA-binding PadR family transcriptional regulator
MKDLSVLEQLILAAIVTLEDAAYGVAIRGKVGEIAGRNIMYGTLYNALDQLLRKGYVTKEKGEPTPERRGRRKMNYRISREGKQALLNAYGLQKSIWASLPDLVGSLEE